MKLEKQLKTFSIKEKLPDYLDQLMKKKNFVLLIKFLMKSCVNLSGNKLNI